jgi:hypothetical protein
MLFPDPPEGGWDNIPVSLPALPKPDIPPGPDSCASVTGTSKTATHHRAARIASGLFKIFIVFSPWCNWYKTSCLADTLSTAGYILGSSHPGNISTRNPDH